MSWYEVNGKNSEGYSDPTATTAMANINREKRRMRGLQNRIEGEHFEKLISVSLDWYQTNGVAYIEKTPEPMKPISKPNQQGQFKACYIKAGQPDFKGTLVGGRAIVFEAKHTSGDRIEYGRLTEKQIESLTTHARLGAASYVMVSFRLQTFYRIPWNVWYKMKELYGRKYIMEKDVQQYRLKYESGVIRLLEGIETTVKDMEG